MRQTHESTDRRVALVDTPYNANTSTRWVEDPFNPGKEILVTASLRDDPLGRLNTHGHIKPYQYKAGRYVQELFEAVGAGGVKAMDTTKEVVDGRGQFIDPITDHQVKAGRKLEKARARLGVTSFSIVRSVLADRCFIEQLSSGSASGAKYIGRRFRDALEELAYVFGFIGGRNG